MGKVSPRAEDEVSATRLGETGLYRVLRRLPPPVFTLPRVDDYSPVVLISSPPVVGRGRAGTGVGCVLVATYDHLGVHAPFGRLRADPAIGTTLVDAHDLTVEAVLGRVRLTLSHDASDGLAFLRAEHPGLQAVPRVAVGHAVPWSTYGIDGTGLDSILAHHGRFTDTSDPDDACTALHAILTEDFWDGHVRGPLSHVLAAVSSQRVRVEMTGATYRIRDALKARGWKYSDGIGSIPKGWHLTAARPDVQREVQWVEQTLDDDVRVSIRETDC